MAENKELIFEVSNGIATITLNRPDRLNAFTTSMLLELPELCSQISTRDDIKVAVITGAGRGFCSGSDFQERIIGKESQDMSMAEPRSKVIKPIGEYAVSIWDVTKPTIAAINGVAAGAGVSLALLCDIRIASDTAKFILSNVRIGLIPDGASTYLLPKILGVDKALKLAYTGDSISAEEALKLGLVTEVVPHSELGKATAELARKIADGPSIAIELIKRGMYRGWQSNDIKAQLDFETFAVNLCKTTQDFKEGVRAFTEKRPPKFTGK